MTFQTSHYERVADKAPMILTPRDEEIIRAVGRFRFLRSDQITTLIDGSKQGVLRRLARLFHHGYLSRPKRIAVQIALPGHTGLIYSLGSRGRKYLTSQGVLYSHRQQEKQVKILYLAHTLKVADFMINLEKNLPEGVELYHHDEFRVLFSSKEKAQWKVPINYRGKELSIGVIPDYLYALVQGDQTCVYCLEMDRGTMPVYREKPYQTSFLRKILAYQETWRSGFAKEHFGWSRFRVVTVTSSSERLMNLVGACKEACQGIKGEGLFLFSSEENTKTTKNLFYHPWTTGKGVYPEYLLS